MLFRKKKYFESNTHGLSANFLSSETIRSNKVRVARYASKNLHKKKSTIRCREGRIMGCVHVQEKSQNHIYIKKKKNSHRSMKIHLARQSCKEEIGIEKIKYT